MKRLSSYKFWLVVLTINYVFVDFLRRLFNGSQLLLIILDVNIVIILVLFFGQSRNRTSDSRLMLALRMALILYMLMIVLQSGNQAMSDFPSTFTALRSYLLPIPFVLVGYRLAAQDGDQAVRQYSRVLLVVAVLSIGYGILLFLTDSSGAGGILAQLLTPMENATHSFGSSDQRLTASFFASSWRFSTFMLVSYLILWAVTRGTIRTKLILFVLFFAGFYVAGNRTGLTLFLTFNATALLLFSGRRIPLLGYVGVLSIAGYFLLSIAAPILFEDPLSVNPDMQIRLSYMFSDTQDYGQRLGMGLPIPDFDNPDILLGLGIGKYGQETAASPSIAARAVTFPQAFFHELPDSPVADSGLTKIIIETGILGALVFVALFGTIIWYALRVVWQAAKRNDRIGFAVAFFLLIWLVLFMKGHPTISDIVVSTYLYLAVGFTAARYQQYRSAAPVSSLAGPHAVPIRLAKRSTRPID